MRDSTLSVSDDTAQTEERFQRLVERCRVLKDRGKLRSGVEYYIDDQKRISVRTLKPEVEIPGQPFDIESILRHSSGSLHVVRHYLSTLFDLSAEEWNNSAIGRLLKFISDQLREGTYKADAEKETGNIPVYNIYRYMDLHEILAHLASLVLSEAFRHKSEASKLAALNALANEESTTFRKRADYMTASMTAETILVLDELRRIRSSDEAVNRFVRYIVPPAERLIAGFENI